MRRIWIAAAMTFGWMAALGAPSAVANETNCTANSALASEFPEVGKFICTQVGQTSFDGASIRIIKDKATVMAQAEPFLAPILEAAPKALAVYHKLAPSLELHAIDFIISPKSDIGAVTKLGAGDVCLITINDDLKAHPPASIAATFKPVIAHEIVHCIQRWNFAKQVSAMFALWWAEGSADYLATLVYADGPGNLGKWIAKFDAASSHTALTQMTYETYIFFAWMAQEKGPKSVFDFMAASSKQGGHPAQRAAVVAFLGADKLQDFARDYLDKKIRNVKGAVIGNPQWPAPHKFDDDDEEIFTGQGFTIFRGQVAFSDGTYNVTGKSGENPDAAFSKEHGPWQAIDAQVTAGCDKPVAYRYSAFPVKQGQPMHLVVAAKKGEKQKSCKPCTNLAEQSQCLVGTWNLDREALRSFLQIQMWDDLDYKKALTMSGSATLQFKKDGTAVVTIPKLSVWGKVRNQPVEVRVTASGVQTGHWSSKASLMRICPVQSNLKIDTDTKITIGGQTIQKKTTHTGGSEVVELTLQCAGSQLTVTSNTAKLNNEPLEWHAQRIK